MASNVKRDHHLLTRNLKLNGNYISNDGDDEGLKINDLGAITLQTGNAQTVNIWDHSSSVFVFDNGSPTSFRMNHDSTDYFKMNIVANGITTFETTNNSADHQAYGPDLIFKPGLSGAVIVDKDVSNTITGDYEGLQIDIDHTGIVASGQTRNTVGLDVDMNTDGVTHVGTVNQIGIDLDLVAATDGTQTNTGIDVSCTGADTNNAAVFMSTDTQLRLKYDASTSYCDITIADDSHTTIATAENGNIILDTDGNVGIGESSPQDTLEVNGTVLVKDALKFTQDDGNEFIDSQADGYLDIGATTAIRLEAPTLCEDKLYFTQTDGNEYIDSLGDGYLDIDATTSIRLKADVELGDGGKLYLDAGDDTYMVSNSDTLDIVVGGTMLVRAIQGINQKDWLFRDSAVGFEQVTASYHAVNTPIDFREGNKVIVTFGTGNITNLNCTFPALSGNYLVLIKQDTSGSRTITNYKAFDSAGNAAAGSSAVKFAGGSAPTLTTDANHVDIISFYWDATNEIAYAVPTLDFQF